jgi:hypothetical protein
MRAATAFLMILMAFAGPASAASPDAWAEFAADVEAKCLALVEGELDEATIRVDPTGSERFGLALVSGSVAGTPVDRLCVMDKASGEAEIGGELPR